MDATVKSKARLAASGGPLEGKSFPLSGHFSIGRAPDNTLPIDDRSVSRRHCVIEETDEGFRLFDRGSANQTRVNGIAVFDRLLVHGDEVEVGVSRFLFLEEDREATSVVTGETNLEPTLVLSQMETLPSARDGQWAAATLAAFLRLANGLPSVRTLDALARELLEATLELVRADSASLLLPDASGDLRSSFSASSRPDGQTKPVVSRALLKKVCEDRTALIASQGDAAPPSESFVLSNVTSAAVAPLVAGGSAAAVLYLERRGSRFNQQDLQLLVALAGLGAAPLQNLIRVADLEAEARRLRAEIASSHNMVGSSQRMEAIYQFVARVAPTDSTVLIHGESGTGKELVARALHANSPRSRGPFVAVNCAALTETLLESELFGHEKGAFTGAIAQRKGKLEEAEGGTFFLDEVGEMPLSIQAKFLRVLQEREFQRVGGSKTLRANVRVVAATNRDLEEAARRKEFRADLYYRLKVVSISIPPLRQRREDIEPLVRFFIRKHAGRVKRTVTGVTPETLECLRRYDWPGNIRELENAIERAVVLGLTPDLRMEDFPDLIAEAGPDGGGSTTYHGRVLEAKRQIVRDALAAGGSHGEAARILGLHPNNLHRLIRTLGLKEK